MDVTLPDGTTVKGVPDGTTKDQLAQKLKANGRNVPNEWLKPAAPVAPEKSPVEPSISDRLKSGAVGFVQDATKTGLGGAMLKAGGKGFNALDELVTKGAYLGGQKVSDVATKFGAPPELSGGLGAAANVGIQIPSMLLGGGAAKKVASPMMREAAVDLMQSALKPVLSQLKSGDAAVAIDTMLEKGINITKGGVQKIRKEIEDLDVKIKQAISTSPEKVKADVALRPLAEKLREFKKQVNPDADVAAIKKSWEEFKNHPALKGSGEMSVKTAQELKQGTYKQLSKKYGEMGSSSVEAQKAIARGLKEGIAKQVPTIAEFNKEQSRLIRTLKVAERRVLMDANKNPMGLSLLAKNPAAWATFMADRSPTFKSILARILNAGKERIPQTAGMLGVGGAEAIGQQRQQQAGQIPSPP